MSASVNANGLVAPPVNAISRPASRRPIAPSIVSRSGSRIRPRTCEMTTSVIAATASTSRISPWCAAHRSVTATTVEAAKMKTHVATRITRYSAAGRRSPGAVRRVGVVRMTARSRPVHRRDVRPRSVGLRGAASPRTTRAKRRSVRGSPRGEPRPERAASRSARHAPACGGAPVPRPGILLSPRESATGEHASSGACRHRVAAAHRGRGPDAPPPAPIVRTAAVSGSPTGSSASSGAGRRTSRSRGRRGSCAGAPRGTRAAPRCPRRPPRRGCRSCPP